MEGLVKIGASYSYRVTELRSYGVTEITERQWPHTILFTGVLSAFGSGLKEFDRIS